MTLDIVAATTPVQTSLPAALPAALLAVIESYAVAAPRFAGGRVRLADLRDPELARGRCSEVADGFAAHCRAAGLDAEVSGWWDPAVLGYPLAQPLALSGDVEDGDLVRHRVVLLRVSGCEYAVDWTAAQYGEQAFPAVRRRLSNGP